uniref:Protein kinase domain-containing protein n=1 Tax=Lotharella oceanica TaxID=641309 RepID=A0A7S2U0D7_9EUKA|mmetsp:Transcript_4359/g.8729  ORF Transcript_4359/g.8729 Transcript_4359/m.8729 type:complete len:307 (+) Transcript_4359:91-1011(+)|eukprot:CAMPEP_0170166612 /NCGR_PEP_ID=MMETSP0040_2-20121228/252_1 /TAXON_ID=641309 /ORGANISM="Lotharella oceanica, Strain CCMP622" /LENGTH=306 /DNA_ID=CAMNT_0010404385 /DNA_START=84 /DNA_END=1004 /DNA_ORIENTATION=+
MPAWLTTQNGLKYILTGTIGEGATAVTKVGVDPDSGRRVAIKFLYPSKDDRKQKNQKRAFEQETCLLARVKDANVVKLEFASINAKVHYANGNTKDASVIGLEFCSNGDLMAHLIEFGKFPEIVARTIFKSIVAGLHACHKQNIAHRDIKPDNILMDEKFKIKIADFGYSRIMRESGMKTAVGTLKFAAPEIIMGQSYSTQADIWSLGVTLFILFVGYPPYEKPCCNDYWWHALVCKRDFKSFLEGHLKLAKDLEIPPFLCDLLSKMLHWNPFQRITTSQIMQHPWFKEKILSQSNLSSCKWAQLG